MKKKNKSELTLKAEGKNFAKHVWKESWAYIKTMVDVMHEPILVLDKDFRVMTANEPFYRTFQVDRSDTEKKIVYQLGNGQWDIPALRKLLEDILPKNHIFKGFQVSHDFPAIGRKVMILNARQILFKENKFRALFPAIILLAMEDITEIMTVGELLSGHVSVFEKNIANRTKKMEDHIEELRNGHHTV